MSPNHSATDDILQRRLARNDKIIAFNLIVMNVVILALFVFSIFQNQAYLEQNRIIGAKNHERTQQYIRCIATILTKPLAQRTTQAFDDCGIKNVDDVVTNDKAPSEQNAVMSMFEPPVAKEISVKSLPAPTIQYRAPAVQAQPSPTPQAVVAAPTPSPSTAAVAATGTDATGTLPTKKWECKGNINLLGGIICI
jgi:hypothetical protein